VATTASSAREIVERYHEAWGRQDFDTARSFLDDDLAFQGPIDTFDNADDYVAALKGLAQIVQGVEPRATVADGDDVVVLFELLTVKGRSRVAEWYRVRDGKIAAVDVYFDARPFAPASTSP
jgi:ketosteroid isomerase-like protein